MIKFKAVTICEDRMKYVAIFLLVALGVYLYKRTQQLAKDEQNPQPEKQEIEQAEAKDVTPIVVADTPSPLTPTSVSQTDPDETAPALTPTPTSTPTSTSTSTSTSTDLSWANAKLLQAVTDMTSAIDVASEYAATSVALAECYKQRKQREYIHYGAHLYSQYIALFEHHLLEVRSTDPEAELKGTGLLHLSTLLSDNGAFDKAIDVCRTAIQFGISDGTVTGFEGRILRIEKAKSKASA